MTIQKVGITAAGLAFLAFAAAQCIRPAMKEPPHEALFQGVATPAQVSGIFERACQDCHSNNTHWPWYAKVTPISFLVAQDVNRGRLFLNLSEWQKYSRGQKLGFLGSMSEATRNKKMPPPLYSAMHANARLTGTEREAIAAWAGDERKRVRKR